MLSKGGGVVDFFYFLIFNVFMVIRLTNQLNFKNSNFVPVIFLRNDKNFKMHPFFNKINPSFKDKGLLNDLAFRFKDFNLEKVISSGNKNLIVLGLKNLNHRNVVLLIRKLIFLAKKERISHLLINLEDFKISQKILTKNDFYFEVERLKDEELLALLVIQLNLANFEFLNYKKNKDTFQIKEILIYNPAQNSKLNLFLKRGLIISNAINNTRILANTPGGEMTPTVLSKIALRLKKNKLLRVKVLDEKDLKKKKMGGILGVASGSREKPRFIIMEYWGGSKKEKPIVLVGKGVTFDSGGLNLKDSSNMNEMFMDMTGGAVVINVLKAVSELKIKRNVIGLVPLVENMPSGSSYRPGDILKTMSGKTIEVLNTDAEGRIILADALTYAFSYYQPSLVIDVATLTGAAIVALGQRANAIFSNNFDLIKNFQIISEKYFDLVWPLPLWSEFENEIQGNFGEVANVGKTRYGGAIIGAIFLWQFVKDFAFKNKDFSWVHLDIAPRMTTLDDEFLTKGASGASVSLLINFLLDF